MTDTNIPQVDGARKTDARKGDWMQTYTGRQFWTLDPRADEICIEDIAHSLAHQCRYAGHCRSFYSVAQHSVYVSCHLPDPLKLWGLLHDAAEAYCVDVPRPLKPFLPGYREIEAGVMDAVCERFGLDPVMPAEVKAADDGILHDEMAQIMSSPPAPWALRGKPLGIEINPWSPKMAKAVFLQEFQIITGGPYHD